MSDSFIENHTDEAVRNASKPSQILKSKENPELNQSPKIKSPTVNGTTQSTHPKAVAVLAKSSDPPLFSKKNRNTTGKASTVTPQTFSPRKTRSRVQRDANPATTSGQVSGELHSKSDKKPGRTKSRMCLKVPQMDGASDKLPSKSGVNSKKAKEAARRSRKKDTDSDSDSDFAPSPPKRAGSKATSSTHFVQTKKPKPKALEAVKRIDLRVLSADEDDSDGRKTSKTTKLTILDTWVEAYNEKDKKWIVIDPVKNKVDAVDHIRVRNSFNNSLNCSNQITFDLSIFYRNLYRSQLFMRLPGTMTVQFVTSHRDIATISIHPHESYEPIHCGWRWQCGDMKNVKTHEQLSRMWSSAKCR